MSRRAAVYATLVLLSGAGAWTWFTLTEEVPPDSNDPGAYDFLLGFTVVAALLAATVLCVLVEVGVRIHARLAQSSRT